MKLTPPTNLKNTYTYHIKEMVFVKGFKRNVIKCGLWIGLFLFTIMITLLSYFISERNDINPKPLRFETDLKYILFWKQKHKKNPYQRNNLNEFEDGQTTFIKQNCPHINCYISYNQSLLNNDVRNFDAIVFDVHAISKLKGGEFNFTKGIEQKYIFRSHESSEKQPVCDPKFDDFFTWTWTYRLSSDIPHPFLNIYDVNNNLVGPSKTINWAKTMNHSENTKSKLEKKSKGVAWIVTRCKSKNKYQGFIKDLRRELRGYNYSVDILGPCGDRKCPDKSLASCYSLVEKHYYFQMVLEDSETEDYVGDSIVKALSYFSVPIVYGGADYTRFLPPGTYINAKAFDFKKIGALIDYLIKNPHMYEYFFDWKNHYFYTVKHKTQVCDLCAKLNNSTAVNVTAENTYREFRKWWNPDYMDICERMQLLRLFNTE